MHKPGRILAALRSYTEYGAYRIHLPEEEDFARDMKGCFRVFMAVAHSDSNVVHCIPLENAWAVTLDQALDLSIRNAKLMIDNGQIARKIPRN